MHVLALDVGTSLVKAAVLDVATAGLTGPVARTTYRLDHPTPDASEVPAERVWEAVAAAAREATRNAGREVSGVGLSCTTPALVLMDEADRPLAPVWTHLDRRSRAAARQVWAAVGPEFLSTTGNRPLPGGITAVCWRQQLGNDPYLRRRVHGYLHLNGWLALRLTGAGAFDPANACLSGLYGTLTDRRWSQRWTAYFDVDPSWLPEVINGSDTIGTLRSAAAVELGVPGGLPVKLGTADISLAILAAGMEPGDLLHEVGATQVLAVLTTTPRPDPGRLTRPLGVGDAFMYVTHNPVGGAALDWLRRLCFREQPEQEFFSRTIPQAQQQSTRVTLDPAYLAGDQLEIERHRASFRDLTLTTDRLELLAAVLEAMRRCHRQALACLGVGDRFQRIFLSGGAANVVRTLIPEYAARSLQVLEEGALCGVARLFQPG